MRWHRSEGPIEALERRSFLTPVRRAAVCTPPPPLQEAGLNEWTRHRLDVLQRLTLLGVVPKAVYENFQEVREDQF